MKVKYQDLQQMDNPLNGKCLEPATGIKDIFERSGGRRPFLFQLRADNGFMLTIGFAEEIGCVQYSPENGSPRYLMAVGEDEADEESFVEFLAGNTPAPIPKRFCLPIELIREIATHFVLCGGKWESVTWGEL